MQVTTTRAWATGKPGSPGLCRVYGRSRSAGGAVGALFWTVSDGREPGGHGCGWGHTEIGRPV